MRAVGLASQAGREVVFGLRLEDIRPRAASDAVETSGNLGKAEVEVVEPLGGEQFVYLVAGGEEFTSRMDTRIRPVPGETMELVFDTSRLHVFDKQTERALT